MLKNYIDFERQAAVKGARRKVGRDRGARGERLKRWTSVVKGKAEEGRR